jgi:hypothetical protein
LYQRCQFSIGLHVMYLYLPETPRMNEWRYRSTYS